MNNIVLSGYYGFDNIGDEAVLAAIIFGLKRKRKNIKITVLSNNPELTQKRYNVEAIARTDIKKIIPLLIKSDVFINGGGSLLQDITGWKSIPYYSGLTYLAHMLNNKTIFYAQGIGPIMSKINQNIVKFILGRSDLITVRDDKSRNLLEDLNIKITDIHKTVDPVFNFTINHLNDLLKDNKVKFKKYHKLNKTVLDPDSRIIGINVRPWKYNYLPGLAGVINKFAPEIEGKVLIIPFHQQEDRKTSNKLKKMLSVSSIIIPEINQPLEMLLLFSKLDFLIGVRLHSLMFAAINHVPFFGISYDPKIEGFIKSLNMENYISIKKNKSDFYNKILNIWNNRNKNRKLLKKRTDYFHYQAENSIKLILNLLD